MVGEVRFKIVSCHAETLWALQAGFRLRAPAMRGGIRMLWTVFVVILILWFLGFSFHIAGGLIHLLLVIALVVLVFNLLTGRRG
jgi:hypothetical protein